MKVKTRVQFISRANAGTGTIVEVRESSRGLWYVVQMDASDKTIVLRAAALTAI